MRVRMPSMLERTRGVVLAGAGGQRKLPHGHVFLAAAGALAKFSDMSAPALSIWCNAKFSDAVMQRLADGTKDHRVLYASNASTSVLAAGGADPQLAVADVAFGQPD